MGSNESLADKTDVPVGMDPAWSSLSAFLSTSSVVGWDAFVMDSHAKTLRACISYYRVVFRDAFALDSSSSTLPSAARGGSGQSGSTRGSMKAYHPADGKKAERSFWLAWWAFEDMHDRIYGVAFVLKEFFGIHSTINASTTNPKSRGNTKKKYGESNVNSSKMFSSGVDNSNSALLSTRMDQFIMAFAMFPSLFINSLLVDGVSVRLQDTIITHSNPYTLFINTAKVFTLSFLSCFHC